MKRTMFYTKTQFHKLSLELLETEIFRIDALLEDHFARSSEKRNYNWLLALRNYLRIDLGYIEPEKIGKGSYTNKHPNTPENINVAFMWIHGQNIRINREVAIRWNPEFKRIEDLTKSDYDLICKKIKRIESKEDSINSTSDHKFLLGKKMKYEILHSEDVAETKSMPYQGEDNKFCPIMPLDFAIEHFSVFTKNESKNGNPYLTMDQFYNFIERAFLGNLDISKQSFNYGTRELTKIKYRFYEFYYYFSRVNSVIAVCS